MPSRDWVTTTSGENPDFDSSNPNSFNRPQKIRTSSSFMGERNNNSSSQQNGDFKQPVSNEGNKLTCNVCENHIKEGDVLKIEPGTWIHSHCFNCAICDAALDPNAYYVSFNLLLARRTPKFGAIYKAQKAQFLNYAKDVSMKNSCFRTSASSLVKRNIVRI